MGKSLSILIAGTFLMTSFAWGANHSVRKPAGARCTDYATLQKNTYVSVQQNHIQTPNGQALNPEGSNDSSQVAYINTTADGKKDHFHVELATNDHSGGYSVYVNAGTCDLAGKPYLYSVDGDNLAK